MGNSKRVLYLDILKTIAIFGVLIIHITAEGFTNLSGGEYVFSGIVSCLVRFSVPVFVMVSGALFLNKNKIVTVKKIYTSYIPRILWALVIFSVFYELVPVFITFVKTGIIDKSLMEAGFFNLIHLNTHYHLYYLYIIVIIYMLVPVVKVFLKSATRNNILYLILFMLAFSIVMPNLKGIYPFSKINGGMTNQYMINLTYGMLLYFLSGHYLSEYELDSKKKLAIYVLGIAGAVFTAAATLTEQGRYGAFIGKYIEAMSINVFFMSIALFVFIKNISVKVKKGSFFVFISKASFLIYLIHDFYNILLRELGIYLIAFPVYLSIPILFLLVLSLSLITYLIVRKIPLINKIL